MLLTLLSPIPFWRPFIAYDRGAHFSATQKFAVLWAISLSPLVFAVLADPRITAHINKWDAFILSLESSFLGTHQYIYAVSFITPIFYLLWEKYLELAQHTGSGKRSLGSLTVLPLGYGWLLLWSISVFLVTAVAYANSTHLSPTKPATLLHELSRNGIVTISVYLFALLCWYFTILDSIGTPRFDYVTTVRRNEKKQLEQFSDRLAERKEPVDE